MTSRDEWNKISRAMRYQLVCGIATLLLVFGGIGGWAASTSISGAVIASGTLVVEGNTKKVQHPTGGVIAELLVREGQQVNAGDVVIRLDVTVTKANLAAISQKLDNLHVRRARLEVERDGGSDIELAGALLPRMNIVQAMNAIANEKRLLAERRATREGQKTRLSEQISQLREQIGGLEIQQNARTTEIALIHRELVAQRELFEKKLTPLFRVSALERETARLNGERGHVIASIASARGRIAEIELQRLLIDQTMRSDVSRELRDVENLMGELAEQEVARLEELRHIEVKAPDSGTVHKLAVHTIGGVISAAEVLMEIVPRESDLIAELRIRPQDIDQLSIDQTAVLQFTSFNRNTTPEVTGMLTRISADLEHDDATKEAYFRIAVNIPSSERVRIANFKLIPGMPVEAFIRIKERTVLSYITKPLRDHTMHVFRDD